MEEKMEEGRKGEGGKEGNKRKEEREREKCPDWSIFFFFFGTSAERRA